MLAPSIITKGTNIYNSENKKKRKSNKNNLQTVAKNLCCMRDKVIMKVYLKGTTGNNLTQPIDI